MLRRREYDDDLLTYFVDLLTSYAVTECPKLPGSLLVDNWPFSGKRGEPLPTYLPTHLPTGEGLVGFLQGRATFHGYSEYRTTRFLREQSSYIQPLYTTTQYNVRHTIPQHNKDKKHPATFKRNQTVLNVPTLKKKKSSPLPNCLYGTILQHYSKSQSYSTCSLWLRGK